MSLLDSGWIQNGTVGVALFIAGKFGVADPLKAHRAESAARHRGHEDRLHIVEDKLDPGTPGGIGELK